MRLLADDAAGDAYFGWSLDADGEFIIVGAERHAVNGIESGAAYIFDASTGVQLHRLVPADPDDGDRFGFSVAIDDGLAVVGAQNDDELDLNAGAAYVFDVATGTQLQVLLPNTDDASGASIGKSVAIENGIAVVGASLYDFNGSGSGAAWVFDAHTGQQIWRLLASDGAADDRFGYSVGIDQETIIVGAFNHNAAGSDSGAAYLFDLASGAQLHKLTPVTGAAGDMFGYSVAIDQGTAVIGAVDDDDLGPRSGAAFVFDADTGVERHKLLPDDGEPQHFFGRSVAIDGGDIIIGASGGSTANPAYLFDATTGEQVLRLRPVGATRHFGESVAVAGSRAFVGSWADADFGAQTGAVYAFAIGTDQRPCTGADLRPPFGVLDLADVNIFVSAFVDGYPDADANGDGLYDLSDVSLFVTQFVAGCT